jgi:hypothetical protein
MSRESARIIHAALLELPLEEQVIALICALVERRKPEPLRALVSMSAAITAMARYLAKDDRIALAEILRDSADEVERRREVEPVD